MEELQIIDIIKDGGNYALIGIIIYFHNDIKKLFVRKVDESNKLIGEKLTDLITLFVGNRLDRIEKEIDKIKKNGHS